MKSTTHLILTCLLATLLLGHGNAQSPADSDQAAHQRIAAKVERIKAGVQKMMQSGNDPSAIAKTMSEKVAPLLDSGKFTEAEPVLDSVLAQLKQDDKSTNTPATSPESVRQRIMAKVERIKAGVQKMAASGNDPSDILKTMGEKVGPLLDAGNITDAEPLLDSVIKQLYPEEKTTSTPADSPEAVRQRIMAKVERIKAGVQKMAASGSDPSAILKTMGEKVGPLLDAGNITDAEPVLDSVLRTMGLEPEAKPTLMPADSPEAMRQRLMAKMERVKAGAQAMADGGSDPSDILRAMEQKFKPLIEAGKAGEAEAVLDGALQQLTKDPKSTGSPASSTETVHQRVAAKIELIKAGVRKLAEGGTDPSAILATMQEKVAPLLDSGRLLEAEPELDRVLAQLKPDGKSTDSPPATTKSTEAAPPPADTVHQRIVTKIERIKAGGSASPDLLKTTEEKLGPLIEAGKFAEAEAELDRVLAQLKPDTK